MKRILVDSDVCSGCRACEVACVAHHEGRFGTATARIRVVKVESLGIDQPHVCRLCRRAPCVVACPTGALYRDNCTGAVLLDTGPTSPSACIGCSTCVDACPFGMAALHPETGMALICDLCGGDPACVKRCATGALVYQEGDARTRARREALTRSGNGKGMVAAGLSESVESASLCACTQERHRDAAPTDCRGEGNHV